MNNHTRGEYGLCGRGFKHTSLDIILTLPSFIIMKLEKMSELICIHKREEIKSRECVNCTGVVNWCGYYQNTSGRDPFEKSFKERRKQMYEDEELGLWY